MPHFREFPFLRLVVLPVAVAASVSACAKYVVLQPPLDETVAQESGKVRVTLADGSRFLVAHPTIRADSLIGFDSDSWDGRAYTDSVQVALDDVFAVEKKKTDIFKSVAFAILVLLVVEGILVAAAGGIM